MVRPSCSAQMNLRDTVKEYNKQRLIINLKGMQVLTGWGIANTAVGAAGYFAAKDDQWKYFHGMNAAWGIVNTGIAAYGFSRIKNQARERVDFNKAYNHYKQDKKVLLVNMGLDVAYIAGGYYLMNLGTTDHNNPQLYLGFGRSIMIQGAFLLAFDNILLLSHNKYSGHWATILDEMRFTGNGFSYVHTF
ncbi:DUF6992 family protein [Flavipsychrobacter stenotrophus]|nr:hypothetical protein [Flavipsychrobacter stenotrophus]